MRPTLESLATLGRDMRSWQNRYFHGDRSSATLDQCRKLERAFDADCKAALEPAGLFDGREAEAR